MQRYDPEGPGGPGWSPPDLETPGRALANRFRGLGGSRIAAGILGALLLILFWSSWFTVQPEETGVVQRFGAVVRTVGPGLHFKLPYGIDTVGPGPQGGIRVPDGGHGCRPANAIRG